MPLNHESDDIRTPSFSDIQSLTFSSSHIGRKNIRTPRHSLSMKGLRVTPLDSIGILIWGHP